MSDNKVQEKDSEETEVKSESSQEVGGSEKPEEPEGGCCGGCS